MVEKQNEKLKAKGKAATACPEAKSNPKRKVLAKSNPKRKVSGGPTGQVPKKGAVKSFASIAKPMAVLTRPTTP
jgi:hypothetical protein